MAGSERHSHLGAALTDRSGALIIKRRAVQVGLNASSGTIFNTL